MNVSTLVCMERLAAFSVLAGHHASAHNVRAMIVTYKRK